MGFVILCHCAPAKCGTNLEIGSIFSFQSRGWAFGEAKIQTPLLLANSSARLRQEIQRTTRPLGIKFDKFIMPKVKSSSVHILTCYTFTAFRAT